MLEPVLDPFDRAIEPHRDPGQRDLFRIEHHDFWPEAAADKGRDDAHLPLAEARMPAKPLRANTGACVVSQIVMCWLRAFHCATTPRVSIVDEMPCS